MYTFTKDRLVPRLAPSFGKNAPGPFYVSDQCIVCGLPVETAPQNIEWDCSTACAECPQSCFISKQPENDSELGQIIESMLGSCVENIRYCGTDPSVILRLEKAGHVHLCDALKSEATEQASEVWRNRGNSRKIVDDLRQEWE